MIIIVPGDLNRLTDRRLFECGVCGCVFEASRNEYVPEWGMNDEYHRAICPCCGKGVYGGQLIGCDEYNI